MRRSVVTMPGDRLWMPTLLIPSIFSSACTSTPAGTSAETKGVPIRSSRVPSCRRSFLFNNTDHATLPHAGNLQRLAQLHQAPLGGSIGSKARRCPAISPSAIHVEDVAAAGLLPHDPDGLHRYKGVSATNVQYPTKATFLRKGCASPSARICESS